MYNLCLLSWDNLWSPKLTTGNDSEATTGSWPVDFRYLFTYSWHLFKKRKGSKLQCLFSVRAGHWTNWPAGACGDDFARLVLPSGEKVFLQRGSVKNVLPANENQLHSERKGSKVRHMYMSYLASLNRARNWSRLELSVFSSSEQTVFSAKKKKTHHHFNTKLDIAMRPTKFSFCNNDKSYKEI